MDPQKKLIGLNNSIQLNSLTVFFLNSENLQWEEEGEEKEEEEISKIKLFL